MLPFRIVSNTINNNQHYRNFMKYPLVTNWGWLISFFMISIFNGCMINVSKVEPIFLQPSQLKPLLVIYFAIYPLAATVYIFFKSTKVLISVLIGSQFLLAAVLCYLNLPALNPLFVGLLGFNILLFVFVLIFVCKTRGIVVPVFILFFTITLTVVGLGAWAFQLIWYCNLIVTNNKAGRQLRNVLNSFDAAMVSLSGIAAIGLAIGWVMGGFSG